MGKQVHACKYLFKISTVTFKENHTKSTQVHGYHANDVISFISCISKRSFKITLDIFSNCTISHVHYNLT